MPIIPNRPRGGGQLPGLQAPGVVQFQDQTARQTQQVGQGLAQLGGDLFQVGENAKHDILLARSKQDLQRASEGTQGVLDEYRQRIGKDAVDDYESVQERLDSSLDDVADAIDDPEQAEMFESRRGLLRDQALRGVQAHHERQARAFNIGETESSVKNQARAHASAVAAGDANGMALARALLLDSVDELGDLHGWGAEQREERRAAELQSLHAAGFDALVDSDSTDAARDYLKAFGGEMGAARQRAEGILKKATRLEKVMRVSDRVVAKGGSLTEMLERVQELHGKREISAEVRADVERRVEAAVLTQRRERATAAKQALEDAQAWIATGAPLTPQMAQALEDSGEAWKLDAWQNAGGAWRTTGYGMRKLFTISPGELMEFASAEEVWDTFRADLDDQNLAMMVGKWERAQVAAGRAARDAAGAVSGKDAFTLSQDDHLLALYRSLPEIDDNLDKVMEGGHAQWDRYRLAVIEEANRLAGPGGTKTMETLRKAHEIVESEKLYLDGEERTAALLDTAQKQRAQVRTPLGDVDINKIGIERVQAAEEKLARQQQARVADGKPVVPITPEAIYMQAKLDLDAENQRNREVRVDERNGGWARLAAAVRHFRNDPEFRKEWLVYGPSGELRTRVTEQKTDFFGRPKPGWGKVSYTIPYGGTKQSKFRELVMQRVGAGIGADFGIADSEVEEQIDRMLGMSDEALRGVYQFDEIGNQGVGAAAAAAAAAIGGGR
jgi:hypothetical protein